MGGTVHLVATIPLFLTNYVVCNSFQDDTWEYRKQHARGYENNPSFHSSRRFVDWNCLEVTVFEFFYVPPQSIVRRISNFQENSRL
jgi:hypothetical protein